MEILDSSTLKALNTSTRQQIIKLLSKRPYTASEISKILNKHVTTVGEHLEILENSGLVLRKKGNKWVYYRLTQKGENLFKPNYSWSILFSLSIISLFVGSYLYAASTTTYIAKQAETTAVAPAEAIRSVVALNINAILGLLFIALAVSGFAFLAIKHLRAKTLRNQRLYIK